MAGYETILKIRRIEKICERLGFMFSDSKYSGSAHYADTLALKPKDQESLPPYSRDAELFCGTIDQLEMWLLGVQWARDYDRMLFGVKHDKTRERKEQDERNRQLIKILTKGEKE